MKAKNLLAILFPSIIMAMVVLVCFQNIFGFDSLHIKGLMLYALALLFPIIFFIQGIISALTKTNFFIGILVSTLIFLLTLVLYMNSSALGYSIVYLFFGSLGYLLSKFFTKPKACKK